MAKGTFGERLKREREMREVSLNEVTKATRIGPRFLEALENEEWDKLPGGVFNRGFVRAIARFLGLDEENLLAEYDLAHGEPSLPTPQPYENKIPRPPIWVPMLALLGLLAVLGGLIAGGMYGWRRFVAYRAAKRAPASSLTPSSSPESGTIVASAAASAPSSAPNGSASLPLDLSISTSAATHVRVVADGIILVDGDLLAGENHHFAASQQFEVTAGDSSAVLLELNGQAMPPIGTPGASGTIVLSQKDLRQAPVGTSQP
ncbi:MAG: helix-turn-helix domain-containing protein [Candidatus Acidiferrum sp.]|jgi:cytoskeletal protein RodZ